MTKYHQGMFRPKHPEKYKGNVENIVYRSSWEATVLLHFDRHPDVIQYSSEECVIPYISPVDNRRHRYFVDFWAKVKQKDGSIKQFLIEVKPKDQVREPKKPKMITEAYKKKVYTYVVNQAKWQAARAYAEARGWEFKILTEDDILELRR